MLPRKIAFGGAFGMSVGVAQLTAKWSREKTAGNLLFANSSTDGSEFKEAVNLPHGLLSIFMAQSIRDRSGIQDRIQTLKEAQYIIAAMNSYEFKKTLKGPGAFLACFSGMRNEYILPFYSKSHTDGLRGTSDFRKVVFSLLKSTDPRIARSIEDETLNTLASLVYELIENTNDHGAKDEFGKPYSFSNPNVRGLLVRSISTSSTTKTSSAQADRRTAVWNARNQMSEKGKSMHRLEITVFDFGIGIAKSRLKKEHPKKYLEELDVNYEEQLVREAFRIGVTSKEVRGAGVGLHRAVECLTELRAAMRLRTGRVCLWQDFTKHQGEFKPENYHTEKNPLSRMPGTVFTLLIPLNIRNVSP